MRLDVVGWVGTPRGGWGLPWVGGDSPSVFLNVTSATRAVWAHCPVLCSEQGPGRVVGASGHCLDSASAGCPVTAQAGGVPVEVAGVLATRGPCCLSRVAPSPHLGPPGSSGDLLVYFVIIPGEAPGVSLGTGYSRAPRASCSRWPG